MFRLLLCMAVLVFGTLAAAAEKPSRFEELSRQADDAYCSGDFAAAIDLSLEALEAARAQGAADVPFEIDQLARLAGSSEGLRDDAKAADYYGRALSLAEQIYGKNSVNASFYMEAVARALIRDGQVDLAEDIYDQVEVIRSQLVVEGFDAFKARHQANKARLALGRQEWQKAFDTYNLAIASIEESDTPLSSGDELVDVSSETSNVTFVGLARAAWELDKQGGDSERLMHRSFVALQTKWRTPATLALEKAAARASEGGGSEEVRAHQDRDEELSQLKRELEDLHQTWFRKRGQDPAYHEASERLKRAGTSLSPEMALDSFRKQMAANERLLAEYERCGANMTDECQQSIERLQAEADAAMSAMAERTAPYQQLSENLSRIEENLEGYASYEEKRVALEERIGALSAGQSSARRSIADTPTAMSVGEVQSALNDDEALVSFLIGDDEGFIWAISRDKAAWDRIRLDSATVRNIVDELRSGLEPPSPGGKLPSPETGRVAFPLSTAHELYEVLFGPVEHVIAGKKHLILVPTGALTSLPFHVLVTKKPDASVPELDGYRQAAWLTRSHALSTLPGVAVLGSLRDAGAPRATENLSFIGFGDPDFERGLPPPPPGAGDTLKTITRCGRPGRAYAASLPNLPDTKLEIEEVRSVIGDARSVVYFGKDASEGKLKSLNRSGDLSEFRVVYFATHGFVTGEIDGLLEPALALTMPESAAQFDDGLLTASEIAQLKLRADWVVLSACNTSSANRPGEETFSGLARAFLYAGSRALLVSHWHTDSYAARLIVGRTFSELVSAPSVSKAEALQHAMLKIVDGAEPAGAHPSYWAPFVVVGDGRR